MKQINPTRISILVLLALVAAVGHSESIVAVSEEYEDATNADGSGFYWDLIRAVYSSTEYDLELQTFPYSRAVAMVESKRADLWVASYADEEDFAIYPKYAFDADDVSALYLSSKYGDVTESDLAGKRVGWVLGYGYDEYLDVPMTPSPVPNRDVAIQLLQAGRVEFFLDAAWELEAILDDLPAGRQAEFSYNSIKPLPLYMAFADTPKGRRLAQVWDDRMEEMHARGELQAIYAANEDYTDFYPRF